MPSPTAPEAPSPEPQPRVLLGMGYMLISATCYATMGAIIHGLGDELHPTVLGFFRGLFGLMSALPLLGRHPLARLRTRHFGHHVWRSFFAVVSMYAFYWALSMSQLAKVTALHFTTPIFATLMAVILLRERIRARRIAALVAGFAGAMIIMRPGVASFDVGAALVLLSAFLWAMGLVTTKVLARTDSPMTVVLYMGFFFTVMTLPAALFFWQTPNLYQMVLLLGVGILGTVSHVCITAAFSVADASAVLPIDFSRLICASIMGYLFFAEVPDLWTWVGGAVIFSAGTYIAYRESQVRRQPKPATTAS